MKPATAAKKLGVFLPATPRRVPGGRGHAAGTQHELQANPPPWLVDLRTNGPHPKHEVARKLGISTSGLARAGIDDSLTTEQIKALLEDQPEWLRLERATQAEVRSENARIKQRDAERKARSPTDANQRAKFGLGLRPGQPVRPRFGCRRVRTNCRGLPAVSPRG